MLQRAQWVSTRAKSTAAGAKPKPAASINPSVATSAETLSWPKYLEIKRSKRTWQTVVTIPCALLGLAGGAMYFGNLDTDPLNLSWFGVDPFFFYGFCTLGCVGTCRCSHWPTIGGSIWRFTHRRVLPQIDAKDREFFRRIAKNRVDASLQNPTQPVPDYYAGEKVGSLHQYRQWLRDQSKYRRKAVLPEE
ncbi:mitochondrial import protein Pam17 [Flammula alnicola]|nr:mitochondrial import protein Pam17 [Flammula alnicola]